MAVTLQTATRNAACNAIVDLVDVGSANASGLLVMATVGFGTILAELDFANPAFGNSAVGISTANAITSETSAVNTGTAVEFQFQDRDRTVILAGSVGTAGADINLNTNSITIGDAVSISSLTVTVPAA